MLRLGFVIVIASGCGVSSTPSTTGSCDLRSSPQPYCEEYTHASADELSLDAEVMCTDDHGIWTDTTCSIQTVLGGCTSQITGSHGSFTLIDWFYPGGAVVTVADVMAKCTALGAQFVDPP